jgi:ribonuclease Z
MDHFAGFDRLLRICLHRAAPLHLIGPAEFADRVEHKLRAYSLNLLDEQSFDFTIRVAEYHGDRGSRGCEFRAREALRRRDMPTLIRLPPGTLLDEEDFRIAGVVLDHGIPCLAFAFEEKLRVNVWSEGLKQLKLPVGQWLNEAKRAVRRGEPDNSQIAVGDDRSLSLGVLKQHATKNCLRGRR